MSLGSVFCKFMDRRWKILRELTQLFILITFVLSALLSPYFLISSVILIGFYIKNFRDFHSKVIKVEVVTEKEKFEDQDKENIRSVMEYYLLVMDLKKLYSDNYNFIKSLGLIMFLGVFLYSFVFLRMWFYGKKKD